MLNFCKVKRWSWLFVYDWLIPRYFSIYMFRNIQTLIDCSENGPCMVQSDAITTTINPFRWVTLNTRPKNVLITRKRLVGTIWAIVCLFHFIHGQISSFWVLKWSILINQLVLGSRSAQIQSTALYQLHHLCGRLSKSSSKVENSPNSKAGSMYDSYLLHSSSNLTIDWSLQQRAMEDTMDPRLLRISTSKTSWFVKGSSKERR